LILLGYAAFAVLAVVAIYLAAGGSGMTGGDVVAAAVMP